LLVGVVVAFLDVVAAVVVVPEYCSQRSPCEKVREIDSVGSYRWVQLRCSLRVLKSKT